MKHGSGRNYLFYRGSSRRHGWPCGLRRTPCEPERRKGEQMKRKYAVVDYLQKHYPPPEGSGEVEVEFLEGYDSIEGPDGSMGFGVFVPTEEKIYIADDLPGGEESMIETVAHEWKHWLQYCNDEASSTDHGRVQHLSVHDHEFRGSGNGSPSQHGKPV